MKKIPTLLISLILFTLPFLLPRFVVTFDVSTLLTVVSLLFAILVGFFIAASTTNYLRLQTLIAMEDGIIVAIYQLCAQILPSKRKYIADAIDQYVIEALDYPLTTYVEESGEEFARMIRALDSVRPKNQAGYQLYQLLHQQKAELHSTRGEVSYTARRIVKTNHWLIIIALASLIAVLLYAIRDGSIFFALITGILTVALFLVLRLLQEIDSNHFLEKLLAYETSEKIFTAIGRIPYYPQEAIVQQGIRPSGPYRLGIASKRPGAKRSMKLIRKAK